MGGKNFGWLVGWLVGCLGTEPRLVLSQTGGMTFVRSLGEAAAPEGGECGPYPDFASNTLAFALQLRKNHGKNSVRVTEGCSADQRQT